MRQHSFTSAKASTRGGGCRRNSAAAGNASLMRFATAELAPIMASATVRIMGSSFFRTTSASRPSALVSKRSSALSSSSAPAYTVQSLR